MTLLPGIHKENYLLLLSTLVLFLSIFVGVFLVQQQQELREEPAVALAQSSLLFEETWEDYADGDINIFNTFDHPDWLWVRDGFGAENYYQIVNSPTRAGNRAMKFYNKYLPLVTYPNGFRTELFMKQDESNCAGRICTLEIGKEHWIGFSIFLPSDHVCDGCSNDSNNGEIHFQIHGRPDNQWSSCDRGEEYRNPLITLSIVRDNWRTFVRGDADLVTPPQDYDRAKPYTIGSWVPDRGKWTDWVYHFYLSYNNDGWLEIYKNGELVVQDSGANAYNDCSWPSASLGTYKWSWKENPTDTDTRTVYFDEIRIGDETASYADVAPRGTGGLSLPTPTIATPTPTKRPTATPTLSPPVTGNLISNPSFASGTQNWLFFSDGVGEFTTGSPAYEGAFAAKVAITTEGNNVQLYQSGISLEPNTQYRLSFAAFSNTGHDLEVKLHKHGEPYTNYGLSTTLDLGITWKTFSFDFTTNDLSGGAPVADARLNFWMAPYDAAGDVYWIDNVVLAKAGATPPAPLLPGDIDQDGDVDIFDYNALIQHFGNTSCGNVADVDGNCKVDIFDYNTLIENFGKR